MSRSHRASDGKDDSILRDILGDDHSDEYERRPPVVDHRADAYRSDRGEDYRSGGHRRRYDAEYDRRPPYHPEDSHQGIRGSYSYDEFPREDPYRRPYIEYHEPEHRRPRYDEPSRPYSDRREDRGSYEPDSTAIQVDVKYNSKYKGNRRVSEEGEVSGSSSVNRSVNRDNKKFSPIVFDLKVPNRVRFFTARCNYYDMFAKSKKDSVWRAPQYVVRKIQQALHEDRDGKVLLLFTVHGSQYWQGIAEVDRKRRIEFDAKLARVPLIWIALGDVSYMASPKIPDLFVEENGVKESFEIPEEYGGEFFELFNRAISDDPTGSLGTTNLAPFLKR